jgi:hypothetical protein
MSCHADSPTGVLPSADDELRKLVDQACARIEDELNHHAPFLGQKISEWVARLSPSGKAPEYFFQPRSFPLVHLPWWAAKSFTTELDLKFLADVIYSTINGYYYIRLLDNLMDDHGTIEADILPGTAFFHTEFQAVYQEYFEATNHFWEIFRSAWFSASDAVTRQAHLDFVDKAAFEQVIVAKLAAAQIPVAAVVLRHGAGLRLQNWKEFTLALARFSQMEDDLSDWHHDLHHGIASYFLTQARGQKDLQSVEAWVICEGFQHEMENLRRELSTLRRFTHCLHSPDVVRYLDVREDILQAQMVRMGEAFQVIKDVRRILRSVRKTSDHTAPVQLKRRSVL